MLKTEGVLWHTTMSLDGFVADRSGRIDFIFDYVGPNALASEIIANAGAVLAGRRSYDLGISQGGGEIYGGLFAGPTFIVTTRPPPETYKPGTRFIDGKDLAGAVADAKAAANGKLVVIVGATLAHSLVEAGFVDQIAIHIVPILLGCGQRLFERESGEPIRLEKVGLSEAGAVTNMILRPLRG